MRPFRRQDLIIGMSLAEIFLLLLLIVWWSSRLETDAAGGATVENINLKAENQRLTKRVTELETALNVAQARIKEVEDILEFVRNMVQASSATKEKLEDAYKKRLQDAKRGFPKCREANTLIEVRAADGEFAVVMLDDLDRFKKGQSILGESALVLLLQRAREASGQCRFDYRLTYGSKADYHDARELFEKYFYPERMVKLGGPTQQ